MGRAEPSSDIAYAGSDRIWLYFLVPALVLEEIDALES